MIPLFGLFIYFLKPNRLIVRRKGVYSTVKIFIRGKRRETV